MLGRVQQPDYRRGLNFLSRGDYAQWARRYNRNQVQPIVRGHANPYDLTRTTTTTPTQERSTQQMKIVAMVLAGGEGARLYPLTAEHAKPALPFANGFRIVDFVLSNLVNSRISTIYLLAQYKPESLIQHVQAAWSPWLNATQGSIRVLLPRSNTLSGQFKGTADAVYQYLDVVQAHQPDLVAVFAADHIYRMDVGQMVAFHAAKDADVTVSAVAVPLPRASAFGVLAAGADGRVTEFHEKPKQPAPIPGDPSRAYASMGNYLFRPQVLEQVLEDARRRGDSDFGRDLLPRLCKERKVYAYNFSENQVPGIQEFEERAYWRDVGTLTALAAAQQDAMGQKPRFNLWNNRWPIRGAHETDYLARTRTWKEDRTPPVVHSAPVLPGAMPLQRWRAANKERHSDERVLPS